MIVGRERHRLCHQAWLAMEGSAGWLRPAQGALQPVRPLELDGSVRSNFRRTCRRKRRLSVLGPLSPVTYRDSTAGAYRNLRRNFLR